MMPSTSTPPTVAQHQIIAFTQALYDETKKKGWVVISMKNDWKQIFSFDQ